MYTPPLAYNNGIYIPVINILEVSPQNAVAGFGETLVRTIELSQDGLKAFLNSFTVNINYSVGHSPQSLSVYTPEGGPLSLGFSFDSNTQTLSATIDESILAQIGYTNGWLETTTLYIEEVILIEVCDEVPAPSVLSFGWGCGGNSCKTIEVVASIAPPIAEADIVIETNTSLTDQLCGVNVLDLTVSNLSDNALGAALDFMLSMEQLCAAINFNQEFDITSILINGTVLSMPTFSNGKEVLDLAAVGVLTDVDGDDNADDFAIGGSFDLRIEYQQNCFPMSCGAATGDCFDGWQLTADYANFCG